MFATPDQVSALNASSIDAALQFARLSIDTTERLFNIGLEAGREATSEAANVSKWVGDGKSVQDFVANQSKSAEIGVEKAISISKNIYQVAQQAQRDVSSIIETQMAQINRLFSANLENALKNAPAGADAAIAAIKSTVAASTAAFDSMTKAAKQAASVAEANVHAAVEAAAPRAKTAKSK
jgi:phasin family protein